ncbi:MAG: ABC transporter ATP-binding protein [Oscillospiraceae bacterium]|nr:ABC transporter ATP-binding protein [Oscillospiraceae bacterium]
MGNDVVKTIDLHKHFGKTKALDGLSVNIAENSITGLIGRNGSGKTTLLKILAGQLDKTGGDALVFGGRPADNLPVLNRLVYTYHNVPYEPSLSLNTILYAYRTMFANFDADFADRLMKYFDLRGKMKYKQLSQGMGSIFNFLCALSSRSDLTMLDEPVLGMDVTVRKSAYEILLRDYSEHPRTIIISSHLLSELEVTLSDLLLIEQGALVLHAPIDDIRNSAYRVDGSPSAVDSFAAGKRTIARKSGELSDLAVVYEPLDETAAASARARGLTVSPVRAEDLCVYLTRQNKEDEFECLW